MYFFDTYAIIEINLKNPSYLKFSDSIMTSTILNLGEAYYHYLKYYGHDTAENWRKKIRLNLLQIDEESVAKAMNFKFTHKVKNLSMTDCIGYMLAEKNKIKFLTGDIQFKGMPNVEFVK